MCHSNTNHTYDGKPYLVHLNRVYETGLFYSHLIPENDKPNVLAACFGHDLIEDTRETFSDVKKATNETVAELVYALTNEKGRNRSERANDKYYEGIRNTPYATFIKVCDRIANVTYSKENKSSMLEKYRKENQEFTAKLFDTKYIDMFDHLSNLLQY